MTYLLVQLSPDFLAGAGLPLTLHRDANQVSTCIRTLDNLLTTKVNNSSANRTDQGLGTGDTVAAQQNVF